MNDDLVDLLDYQDVLAAVVATPDGLLVLSAGLDGEDADIVAAAGSVVAGALTTPERPFASVDTEGGRLHVAAGDMVLLMVLAEETAPSEAVETALQERLATLEVALAP